MQTQWRGRYEVRKYDCGLNHDDGAREASETCTEATPLSSQQMECITGRGIAFPGTCTASTNCDADCEYNQLHEVYVRYSNNPHKICDWWPPLGWCDNDKWGKCSGYAYLTKADCQNDQNREYPVNDTRICCSLE